MGGGKKKKSISQMAKSQEKEVTKPKQKQEKPISSTKTSEAKTLDIVQPDPNSRRVLDTIKGMKYLTPYNVASRFNIRLSVAKDFLEVLHRSGNAIFVSGGKNIRIYKPAK